MTSLACDLVKEGSLTAWVVPTLLSFCGLQLFSHNDKLEELILSGNQLSSLQSYIFPPLTSLKVGLGLAWLADIISHFQKLDVSHNQLTSVSNKAFLNLGSSVLTLDLRGNLLGSLNGQLLLPLYHLQVSISLKFYHIYKLKLSLIVQRMMKMNYCWRCIWILEQCSSVIRLSFELWATLWSGKHTEVSISPKQ